MSTRYDHSGTVYEKHLNTKNLQHSSESADRANKEGQSLMAQILNYYCLWQPIIVWYLKILSCTY